MITLPHENYEIDIQTFKRHLQNQRYASSAVKVYIVAQAKFLMLTIGSKLDEQNAKGQHEKNILNYINHQITQENISFYS